MLAYLWFVWLRVQLFWRLGWPEYSGAEMEHVTVICITMFSLSTVNGNHLF